MQGLTTTVNGTEQISATTTLQGPSNEWTCKRWFNNIATNVSAKTHRYLGWFVAAIAAPVTFIPSLACDLYHSARSLYQRNVSKIESPMELRVPSTGREQPVTSGEPTISRSNSPEPTMRSELSAVPPEQPPTVSCMRKAFPQLNTHLALLEDELDIAKNNLAEAELRNAQLVDEATQLLDRISAEAKRFDAKIRDQNFKIFQLQSDITAANAKGDIQLADIAAANKTISDQAAQIENLHSMIQEQNANMHFVSPAGSDITQQLLSAAYDTICNESGSDGSVTPGEDDRHNVEILGGSTLSFSSPESTMTSEVTVTDPALLQRRFNDDFEVISQPPEHHKAPTVGTTSKSTDVLTATEENND